jgi:hypothetical protein
MTVPYPTCAPAAQDRLCEICLHVQPIAQFRRRRRDAEQRMRQCRRCHNEFERYRRAAIRARVGKRRIARDLASVRDATSANRVKALCAAMVRGYGGAEGFVDAWLGCLRRDLDKGGLAALRHLEATVRLIQHCETHRRDYSRMSEEQLLDAIANTCGITE